MSKLLQYTPRILAGIMMFLFGLDKLIPFMPHPTAAEAGTSFKNALIATGYFFKFVGLCEIFVGLAFISGYFVPIALLVMAPLCANFILYHIFLDPANIGGAIFVTAVGGFLAWQNWDIFKPLVRPR